MKVRMELLGVKEIHLGCHDKLESLKDLCNKLNISLDKVMYMGDDMPDYPAMMEVGLAACPYDEAIDILEIAHYTSPTSGGRGSVRDIIEQAMRLKRIWASQKGCKW